MADRTKIVLLLDYYGNLLSEKQLNAMQAYYFGDLSLTEIAENENVSKQAISDLIKRAENKLYKIEKELQFLKKSEIITEDLLSLISFLEHIDYINDDKLKYIHSELKTILKKI